MTSHTLKLSTLAILLAACAQSPTGIVAGDRTGQNSSPLISSPNLIALLPASSTDCSAGGTYFVSYLDANQNGIFDAGEAEKGRVTVCNGVSGANGSNGANGYGAGIQVQTASALSCPAGGSQITTFIDKNNDSVQDADDATTSVSTVCNGANGSNGANGVAGAAATLTMALASTSQCANGGVVYTSLSGGAQVPDVNVVCNGTNGSNGTNGADGTDGQDGTNASYSMGAIGPTVAGKSYSACHHDYLYFPDSNGGARGWLTFRHQSNGAADQGIGSTGFQVWNVDIPNFNLVSEDLGTTYCSLGWNAVTRVLSYTVVDSSDGLQGTSGSIQL